MEIAPNRFVPVEEKIANIQNRILQLKAKPAKQRSEGEKKELEEAKNELYDLKSKSVVTVDLEGRIVVFLDQPDSRLLKKIRPLLSHDDKFLLFSLVNKNSRGANFTNKVVITGFPTIIFCTASNDFDDQESTRNLMISPDVHKEKITAALRSVAREKENSMTFRAEIDRDKARRS